MKLRHILATTALLALGTAAQAATELKFINCGGSDSDFVTTQAKHIAEWEAENPDYKVALEFIPWGQCQEKSITLAAAGNPVAMSYMGSRVLKQLADSELIRPMNLTDEQLASYSETVLRTVRIDDKIWGLPRAFST
jgi:multiple sugar transport system substrate-binding protein